MRICYRCKGKVVPERGTLRKTYPYYCPFCDENMFSFETEIVLGQKEAYFRKRYKGIKNQMDIMKGEIIKKV